VIFDTSLLVGAERGTVRFQQLLDRLGIQPVGMAAITAAELLHGWHRAADPGVRARRGAFVDALLEAVPVFPFGLAEARRHAQLWADLAREGAVIGPHDMLIAATALARGHAVGTLNQREFQRVAGLELVPLEPFLS
jgi:predicted nucleic acid-binding protein